MTVALLASVYDENTRKVYAQLKDLGFQVVNDPEEFVRRISGADRIIVASHGERDKILVGGLSAVTPSNVYVLYGKDGFLILCLAGSYLIPYAAWSAKRNGRKLKILAFTDRFVFVTDERYPAERDPYLSLIMRPVRAVVTFLKEGGSLEEALEVWRRECEEAIKEASSSLDPVMLMAAGNVRHNMYSLKLFDSENPKPWLGTGVPQLPWWVEVLPAVILAFLAAFVEVMEAYKEAERAAR